MYAPDKKYNEIMLIMKIITKYCICVTKYFASGMQKRKSTKCN